MTTDVRIERYAHGGEGVGQLESGKVVFVAGAFPGDLVKINIVEEQRSFARAELVKLLEPSGDRVNPACRFADRCGGCQFQNLGFEPEWRLKTQAVLDVIERIGRLPLPETIQRVGPGAPERYRRRVRFQIDTLGRTGFYAPRSRDIVRPGDCIVTHPSLLAAREALNGHIKRFAGGNLLLEMSHDGKDVAACLTPERAEFDLSRAIKALEPILEEASKTTPLRGIRLAPANPSAWKDTADIGRVLIDLKVLGQTRRVPVGMFNQANAAMNDALVEIVLQQLELQPGDEVLELYSGWGNFSLELLAQPINLHAMEVNVLSVKTAQHLAERDDRIKQAKSTFNFSPRDLLKRLPTKHRRAGRYARILLDPPRSGARSVIPDLGELRAPTVVYVSCDAATLARDLGDLVKLAPYRLAHLALVDMFPRTRHIEVVATMKLDDGTAG